MCCWFVARFAFFWSSSYQLWHEAVSAVDRSSSDSAPSPGWYMNAKVRRFALREHRSWQISPLAPCSLHRWEKVPTEHMWQTWKSLQTLRDTRSAAWNIRVCLWFSDGLERCILGGSLRSRSYAEVPSLLLANRWAFFGPLPGHRVVQWVPSTSCGVSVSPLPGWWGH